MEKTRVPKGKRYWYIIFDSNTGEFWVNSRIDYDYSYDEARFCNGNYFHSEEEASQMARKLRAVLAGADVIERKEEFVDCKQVDELYVRPPFGEYVTPRR